MGILQKLKDTFAPSSELKRRVNTDPWVRTMVITLNSAFGSADLASRDIDTKFIADLDEPTRDGMLKHLLNKMEQVADSPNRTLACRKWVVEEAHSYAPVRALFTSSILYEDEVAAGVRHKLTRGLFEHAEEIVETLFPERVTKEGSVATVLHSIRLESLWAHYRMNFANLGRFALGDAPNQGQSDWLQPFFQGLVAEAELSTRSTLAKINDPELEGLRASLDRDRYLILNSVPARKA